MPRYVFDLECDGFLDEATRIHCLALKDIDTGEVLAYGPNKVVHGIFQLMDADLIIGHNIIKFDLPVLQKIAPGFEYDPTKVRDTLVLSRLIYADLGDVDQGNDFIKPDGKLTGSHSLKAWGQRLGLHKGDYDGGFDEFSQEMLDYNVQDVEVTDRLWRMIESKAVDPRAVELEHDVAFIIAQQERHGIAFDTRKAEDLIKTLSKRRSELEAELETTFKPWFKSEGEMTPKRPNAKLGHWGYYTEEEQDQFSDDPVFDEDGEETYPYLGRKVVKVFHGYPFTKVKYTLFNAGSRHHIADRLMTLYGWKPTEFTESGQPKIDETTLGKLPYKEAKVLAEYFLVQKRLGMLSEGDKCWYNLTKNGRIHGDCITNGAVTGRATHRNPNLAQVPAVGAPYGSDCRELFRASPGMVQVGIDVSGLELRMLAHFLAKWDGGSYGKVVCEGDPHTVNQEAAGLPTRSGAKTFIYAYLYGAGDIKIGTIVDPTGSETVQRAKGKKLKASFTQKTPGLKQLVTGVQKAAERGYLVGLDGRHLKVRSSHAALNVLLQSAGALICKKWMTILDQQIRYRNLSAKQLLWVHDELQFEVKPDEAEEFGKLAVECISKAGDYFNIRVPLTGEYKVGTNWKECH